MLRRQRSEAKAAGICKAEYWTRENYAEQELRNLGRALLSLAKNEAMCVKVRNSTRLGKETLPKSYKLKRAGKNLSDN